MPIEMTETVLQTKRDKLVYSSVGRAHVTAKKRLWSEVAPCGAKMTLIICSRVVMGSIGPPLDRVRSSFLPDLGKERRLTFPSRRLEPSLGLSLIG